MGGGGEEGVVWEKSGKIVQKRGSFAFANLLDFPLWKEVGLSTCHNCICRHLFQVLLDITSIVGILLCIKGDPLKSLFWLITTSFWAILRCG